MTSRILTLRNIRRLYAVFFLALFVILLWLTSFKNIKGYETPLFLELDPLTAVASFLTSRTLYRGLSLSLFVVIGTLFLGRFFCSWICPLGIINQVVGSILIKMRAADAVILNSYRKLFRLKYYILAILLIIAASGRPSGPHTFYHKGLRRLDLPGGKLRQWLVVSQTTAL
jgi:polyferredoxin